MTTQQIVKEPKVLHLECCQLPIYHVVKLSTTIVNHDGIMIYVDVWHA